MKKSSILFLLVLFSISAISQSYMAMVKTAGQKNWSYINADGQEPISTNYKKCYPFSANGLAVIYENKKFHLINTKGEQLETEVGVFKLLELWGKLSGYSDGLIAVKTADKWGFMNTEGKLVIAEKYDKAIPFNGGFAVVAIGTKYMVIDVTGKEIQIPTFNVLKVRAFSEGLASFTTTDKKVGFINTKGETAIEPVFASVGEFKAGLAWAKMLDGKSGYIDTKGAWAIEPQFLSSKDFDGKSGMARVKTATGWSYTNTKGVPMVVTDTEVWGDFQDGLAKGKKLDQFGFFDNTGNWVIKPQFEAVRDFKNGFAAAKQNGLWGFVNTLGEWVIEPKYAAVKDMELVN